MNDTTPTGTDTGNTTSMAKVPAPKNTRTPYNAMDMSNAEYAAANAATSKKS